MLKKWIDGKVTDVPKNGYLVINNEKHLILNIPNQSLEVLNANGIYEYIENKSPEISDGTYLVYSYELKDNIIYRICEQAKIEEMSIDE